MHWIIDKLALQNHYFGFYKKTIPQDFVYRFDQQKLFELKKLPKLLFLRCVLSGK